MEVETVARTQGDIVDFSFMEAELKVFLDLKSYLSLASSVSEPVHLIPFLLFMDGLLGQLRGLILLFDEDIKIISHASH